MAQSVTKWLKYNLAHTQIRLVLILTVSVSLIILTVGLTSYYTSKSVLQEELSEPRPPDASAEYERHRRLHQRERPNRHSGGAE
ncbi:hypothetical protein LJK87_22665 [Paenibacillus sp. P25]|nr:hypothetical protein LJK87_22665 [Paenibacillus sp. P25]